MFLVFLALSSVGLASETPARSGGAVDELTWDLTLNDRSVGSRTLSVRTEKLRDVELRTLQANTQVNASALGISLDYRQKLTANADIGPASFISVIEQGGRVSEIQGRRRFDGWLLSISEGGRARTETLPREAVDLSTADLLDPDSRVPLARFQTARLLFAETGDVRTGTVEPLGPSEITVKGATVPVEGYRWTADDDGGKFAYTAYYTADGWLVRFESRVFGQDVAGTLTAPPPASPDAAPVDIMGPGLQAVEL